MSVGDVASKQVTSSGSSLGQSSSTIKRKPTKKENGLDAIINDIIIIDESDDSSRSVSLKSDTSDSHKSGISDSHAE